MLEKTPGTKKGSPCLQKEAGQNIKDKKGDKRVRDRVLPWGGIYQREVSKHQETLSLAGLMGVLESQRATQPGGKINK